MSSPSLTVRALGPLTDLLDAAHAGKWKYLQSPELLLYLMCETEGRGKTRAQIENDLPIPSSEGSDDNFQARYREVRQRIGGEWILFEDGRYRFHYALPCEFDVREFEQLLKQARQLAHTAPAQAIALFQNALALYRGDFLEGHTKRRSARSDWDADEREWYLVKREELRAARYDALQQLSALLFDARRHRESVEINQQLVAELDDDDDAHYRLLYALGAQGQRSAALRHYKQLRERRGQNALDPKLDALVQQIKRGEIADGSPAAPAFATNEKFTPPFQVPTDLPRFVGRAAQFEILKNEILRGTIPHEPSDVPTERLYPSPDTRHLSLVGMGGIGKTSLAIHAAYRLREQFPDGVLWGNLRESEPLAILASWERAFGCDFSGLPDLNARAASFRSLMHDKRVLVILDDVTNAADARPLLQNGTHTRTIFTTRSADIAAALDAQIIEMPVLGADESADLLTRILGSARVAGQKDFAREIGALLGHLPLALDITAQRLVSRPNWSLREMAERLRAQLRRLDELQLADRAVRATFALSWDTLDDAQKNVLAHVGVFDARSFTADALAYVASVDAPNAREILDALVALSLLSFESTLSFENATRYRQHPLLADFSQERLRERVTGDEENQKSKIINHKLRAETRLSEYYLSFATVHRRDYLALEDEWDNVNAGIELAHAQELWQAVIDYGDVLTDAWFARGRFTDARKNYPYVMRGARELEEQDPYIVASLHWGKACIDQGDYAEAQEHLQHGLQTSREVNDEYNIASALFLLGRVSVERSEYDAAQKFLQESQAIRERIGDRAGVAETLYLMARIAFLRADNAGAALLADRALEIYDSVGSCHEQIVMLRYRGRIAEQMQDLPTAFHYCAKALKFAEQQNDRGEYAAALYDLAILNRQAGKYEIARTLMEQGATVLQRIGDRKGEMYAAEVLSKIAFSLSEYETAIVYARDALLRARDFPDHSSVVRLLFHLGNVYEYMGQVTNSCAVRSEGVKLAREFNHPQTTLVESWIAENCEKA